ncbi:chaperone modulator CbpM [Thermomonas sp. HDW16]|uniref:chaperone modulator CbpM n=1 Tax=Thermomonas sp. HDW16 TaxID=2714945 RepID=UPI0014083E0F|nr:chaperone modulator CbpM [Thermomonas sp. HDW16]QIL20189.1 hypothetical protein G7079_05230 [Thermomonas sp. HDW16]
MKTIDLQAFLLDSRIERVVLERWIARRWVLSIDDDGQPVLTDADAARACFIRDLTRDFGVNDEGIDLVLHLVDQLHGLRRMLADVRVQLDTVSPGQRDSTG